MFDVDGHVMPRLETWQFWMIMNWAMIYSCQQGGNMICLLAVLSWSSGCGKSCRGKSDATRLALKNVNSAIGGMTMFSLRIKPAQLLGWIWATRKYFRIFSKHERYIWKTKESKSLSKWWNSIIIIPCRSFNWNATHHAPRIHLW